MALIMCPECGREKVSDRAPACPNCGFPISEYFGGQAKESRDEKDGSSGEQGLNILPVDIPGASGTIGSLCERFLEEIGEDANSFRCSPKLNKGLGIPADATVYLAHDDTLFKSGKNGFAITDRGIYCRDLMEDTVFTSLEELKAVQGLQWGNDGHSLICADEKALVYYTDGNEDVENRLMQLLEDIILLLSKEENIRLPTETENSFNATDENTKAAVPKKQERKSLFDFSGGGNMGFASVSNTREFTDGELFEKLSNVKMSFGQPVMGNISGTPAVMYKNVTENYDVFCRVHRGKIIMGKIGSDGVNSVDTACREGTNIFAKHNDVGTSMANRAVDELLGVIKKLENGEEVYKSDAPVLAMNPEETVSLYMQQKAISLKPKFDVFDKDGNVAYHIEGELTGLSFSVQKNGVEVLKLKKKLVAIMPEYTILKNNREIARIKKKFKLTNPELQGQINGQELKICGDLLGYDFDIQVGGAIIGHVDTDSVAWSDCYRIRSFSWETQDLIIALAIICDNVSDQQAS